MEVNFLSAITNLLCQVGQLAPKIHHVLNWHVVNMFEQCGYCHIPISPQERGLFIHDVMILHFDTEQNIHVSSKNYEYGYSLGLDLLPIQHVLIVCLISHEK